MRTFIFIISILFCTTTFAQNDSLPVRQYRYGLRVGADVSKLARSFFEDNYQGFEIMGDYRLNKKWYIAAELGTEEKTKDELQYNFTSNGSYIKAGMDWNAYENWYGMENIISVGFRYGFSTYSQTVNSYKISSTNQYWNEGDLQANNPDIIREYSGLSAHWIEFVLGMKVELFNNLFITGSARINYMVTDNADANFPSMWVPGFNKVTEGSSFGLGYNYGITYFIPLYKKAAKKKNEEKKEEDKN